MDDYRFRAQQSPRTEAPMNSLVSPPRNGTRMPQPVSSHDPRTTLPRRFTTDSGRVPTLSTITTTQRPPEPQEYPTAQSQYKAHLFEKKKIEYEKLREQKRLFEAEMQNHEFELAQLQEDMGRGTTGLGLTGHQSEPTTPPEYRETSSGFPTMFSRPNRYSTSSLTSPPGIYNTSGRSGSQLASPQSGIMPSRFAYDDQLPSRSVPASRRNSDEDEKEEALRQDPTSHRSTNALNRYSMPVTRRGNLYDNIDQTNAAGFLFKDDESTMDNSFASADTQLLSQKGKSNRLSANSVVIAEQGALLNNPEAVNNWNKMHRSQQSLSGLTTETASVTSGQGGSSSDTNTVGSRPAGFRHSLDMKSMDNISTYYPKENVPTAAANIMSPQAAQGVATPPKLQASFSSNDVPTAKSVGASAIGSPMSNVNAHAQQHFHQHNASMGRVPPNFSKRHSRDFTNDNHVGGLAQSATFPSIGTALHGNAAPWPATSAQTPNQSTPSASSVTSPVSSMGGFQPQPYFNGGGGNYTPTTPNGQGYGLPMLTMGMDNMNLNGYSQNYTGYSPMYQPNPHRDSQQRVIQQRRAQDNEAMSRFNNTPLETLRGQIFELCKDQHGCRYLQKQLETRNPDYIYMIYLEVQGHVVELMTDPFGNYLCQKLLELCSDSQRTGLIQNASKDMVRIALNQHGTRALQKMIEFVNIKEHVDIIVDSLKNQVVDLIQDLNGNHVIQKCLNKLSAEDAEFVFAAVGNHCIDVGTHRHGCCVLQRCIDHATGTQKVWLIGKITENAQRLVIDPFGNYVVQYIIDLNEPAFTEPVVQQFLGRIVHLSRHKFSSNVIEKCLRCASESLREMMINELLNPGEMDRLLRDNFGNYVVQTALEHSSFPIKHQLVDAIRPLIPSIRSTPYGRRLQAKIQGFDASSASSSGQTTPADPSQGQISVRAARNRGLPHHNNNNNNNQTVSPQYPNNQAAPPYANGVGDGRGMGRGLAAYPPNGNMTEAPPPGRYQQQNYAYPPGADGWL